MPASGGMARELFREETPGHERYNTLAWTPDQRFLLFARKDSQPWRLSAAGGEPQQMLTMSINAKIKSPAVHPDGKSIVFGTLEGNNEIWAFENFLPAANATK